MPNPAILLAELIESFAVSKNGAVQNHRALGGHADPHRDGFWDRTLVAVGHLNEVVALLDALQAQGVDVSIYRSAIPAWANAIFRPEVAWQAASSGGTGIDSRDLNMLRSLGQVIDAHKLTARGSGNLDAVVAALREAADFAESLDEDVRGRLLGLIRQALRFAEDVDLYGVDAALRLANEVNGVMLSVIVDESTGPERRKKALKIVQALILGIAVNYASGGILALGEAGFNAIGS